MKVSHDTKFIGLAALAFGVAAVAVVTKVEPTTSFGAISKGVGIYSLAGNSLLFAKGTYNSYRDDIGKRVNSFLSFH